MQFYNLQKSSLYFRVLNEHNHELFVTPSIEKDILEMTNLERMLVTIMFYSKGYLCSQQRDIKYLTHKLG